MPLFDRASSVKKPVIASTPGVSTAAMLPRPPTRRATGTGATDRGLLVGDEEHEQRDGQADAPGDGKRRLDPADGGKRQQDAGATAPPRKPAKV